MSELQSTCLGFLLAVVLAAAILPFIPEKKRRREEPEEWVCPNCGVLTACPSCAAQMDAIDREMSRGRK